MSTPKPSLPPDYEELDFKIDEEEWNEYELEDGVTIKGRIFTKIKPHYDLTEPKITILNNSA